jgi:ATP-dependent Clp protease ATP-binding subunit ClpA
MFERFTPAARDLVVRAQQEARDLNQSPIGTQHVLLAAVADETGPIAAALREYGVDEVFVRDEIIKRAGSPPPDTDPLPDADSEDKAALKAIGIDLDAVRRAIEENFGPGALQLPPAPSPKRRGILRRLSGGGAPQNRPIRGHIPFSPRAKKVLELSLREALRLKHNFIAPEHIALGMLREGQGLGARILADANVDFDKLRADLTRSLNQKAA